MRGAVIRSMLRILLIVVTIIVAPSYAAHSASATTVTRTGPTIAAGRHHTLVADSNGGVWSFGGNDLGQLGRAAASWAPSGAGLTHVVAVSAGNGHSLALRDDGTVWMFGN